MSENNHAIVWLDHSEAKVFRISGDEESQIDIHSMLRFSACTTGPPAGRREVIRPTIRSFFTA